MRGDHAALAEVVAVGLVFAIERSVGGAGTFQALGFAISMVALQIFSMAAVTVAYRISPFHPLAKFPG